MAEARCPLSRRFVALARRQGDVPAIVEADGRVASTRADLAGAAERLGERLAPAVGPGDRAVLSLRNSPQFVAAFVALRTLGVTVALVDAAAPATELESAAEAVGARLVVAAPEREIAGDRLVTEARLHAVLRRPEEVVLPRGTVVLKLTSGSTGRPGAVALTARQLAADAAQIMRTMGFGGGDVTLAAIPLSHSYGIGSCLLPLLLAGTPLVFPASALPAALLAALAGARVAHFPAVPAMVRALANVGGGHELSSLRVCLAAGAPLRPADAAAFHDRFGVKVHVFYGASECGGITYDRSEAAVHRQGAVGTALEGVHVEAVDDEGRPVPPGCEGRIRVRSRAVAAALHPPSPVLERGAFLTSDLGILDPGGELTLTGRVSDLLNVGGKKLHPEEIRHLLESLPGVRSAVVLGLPDRHRGDLVAAVVAVEEGSGVNARDLLAVCRSRLAPHKVPRKLVVVDELPTSERGKVRRDEVLRLLTGTAGGVG